MSDRQRGAWVRQFNDLANAIPREAIRTLPDGAQVILPGIVDDELLRVYHEMMVVGAAKGWL